MPKTDDVGVGDEAAGDDDVGVDDAAALADDFDVATDDQGDERNHIEDSARLERVDRAASKRRHHEIEADSINADDNPTSVSRPNSSFDDPEGSHSGRHAARRADESATEEEEENAAVPS